MSLPKLAAPDFTIGHYLCPKTKRTVPLHSARPLAFVDWPLIVQKCPECGERHVVESQNLEHPPVFGYE